MCKSFKLKTHIASQHTQNWDTKNGAIQSEDVHSQYLSNTLNTYLLPTRSSIHIDSLSKRKVDNYTMLTLASNVLDLLKNGSWYPVNSMITKNFWFYTYILKKEKRKNYCTYFHFEVCTYSWDLSNSLYICILNKEKKSLKNPFECTLKIYLEKSLYILFE